MNTPAPQVAFMGPMDQVIRQLVEEVKAALPTEEEKFMRPKEVSDEFKISVDIIRRLIKQNRIPHTGDLLGDARVPRSQFIQYVRDIALGNVKP